MISLIDSIKWFWKNGLFYIFHDSDDIYKSTDRRLCRWGQQYSWNYVNTSQSYGVQIFTYFRPSSSFIIPFSDPTCPIFCSWARFCFGLSKVTDFYHEIPKFFVPRSSKIIVLTWLKTLRMFQSLSLMTSELIKKRKIFREILIKKMSNFEYINFSLSVQSFYKRKKQSFYLKIVTKSPPSNFDFFTAEMKFLLDTRICRGSIFLESPSLTISAVISCSQVCLNLKIQTHLKDNSPFQDIFLGLFFFVFNQEWSFTFSYFDRE